MTKFLEVSSGTWTTQGFVGGEPRLVNVDDISFVDAVRGQVGSIIELRSGKIIESDNSYEDIKSVILNLT